MIVYLIEKERSYSVFLEGDRKDLRILNESAYLIQQKGSWSLRLPCMLKKEIAEQTRLIKITHRKSGETALLYFIRCDSGWKTFERFEIPDTGFSIGSSVADDLTLISEFLGPHVFTCNPQKMTIQTDGSFPLYINGKRQDQIYHYQCGDVMECFELRIVLHRKFIMINRIQSCAHSLNLYPKENISCQPEKTQQPVYCRHPLLIPEDTRVFKIEEPEIISVNQNRSILFSMGPPLMMSMASLSGGILSAWIGYNNGREIVEMLPMVMLPGVMVFSTLLWNPLQAFSEKRKQKKEIRNRNDSYQRYLDYMADQIIQFRQHYAEGIQTICPSAQMICETAGEAEKINVLEPSSLIIRPGISEQLIHPILDRTASRKSADEITDEMYEVFRETAMRKTPAPYIVNLNTYRHIIVCAENSMLLIQFMIQIAGRYHPDEVGIVLLCSPRLVEENLWLLDLPHLFADSDVRLLGTDQNQATEILNLCTFEKRKLILFNMLNITYQSEKFICEIRSVKEGDQMTCDLCISGGSEWIADDFIQNRTVYFQPDPFSMDSVINLRRLPMRHTDIQIAGSFSFLEMYGCTEAEQLEIEERWRNSDINQSLCALIGCTPHGEDIYLDLNEKRDGPHGLIAGTTGSGKSELILTMILSLAISYSPRDLQFMLIDFKGGSSFTSLTNQEHFLPHVTGTLSNLDSEDMHRVLVQFSLECRKREALMRKMSELCGQPVMNVSDYRKLWTKESGLEYISELIIIADEFAQLKKENPEFLNELISIARIGRSLGIHLILSTQKPTGVVTDQIWSNCKFKICLKTAEKQDSMEMIHTADAASIREAGCFWLLSEDRLIYGRSGYVQARNVSDQMSVVLYDRIHRVIKDSSSNSKRREPEINRVIDLIADLTTDVPEPLWKPRLSVVTESELVNPYAFAIADDYYSNERIELCLSSGEAYAFICPDIQEKKQLTQMLAAVVLKNASEKDELIIVDDLACPQSEIIRNASSTVDVFSSADKDRTNSMYDLLKKRSDQDGILYVIINDLNTHYECSDTYRSLLMKAVRRCSVDHTILVLMASSSGSFSYRETALIKNRYCLKDTSAQEISAFLETACKTAAEKTMHGFTVRKNILEFCLLSSSVSDIQNAVDINQNQYPLHQKRVLPHIPEKVRSADCPLSGIPLGILRRNYSWRALSDQQKLCVVTDEDEQAEFYSAYLKRYDIQPENVFPFTTKAAIVTPQQLDDFDSSRYRDIVFLFIRNAFRMQYRVHVSVRLEENESVIYENNRAGVIVLAEE